MCVQAKTVWKTLSHQGVTFPPAYVPHGVKLLYNGAPVDLSPDEEEARAKLGRASVPNPQPDAAFYGRLRPCSLR